MHVLMMEFNMLTRRQFIFMVQPKGLEPSTRKPGIVPETIASTSSATAV